ncbi:MAG: MFS transporter [Dehalococcoidia bacterium]
MPLLQQFRFFRFILSTLTANIAQNALLYTLLIVVIDETGSSIHTSIFVICSLLPVIVLGLLAGVIVDYLPNKPILITANLARAGGALLLLQAPTSVGAIYLFAMVMWTVQQFSSPAATSALPSIVARDRFNSGMALLNVTSLVAQLIGMVLFAPLVLKLVGGPEPVYLVSGILYAAAAYFIFSIPNLTDLVVKKEELLQERTQPKFVEALSAGWRMLRSDSIAFQAMVQFTLLEMATAILIVLMPQYTEDVIGTSAENLVYIFSPAALGLFLGLWSAQRLGKLFGNPATARIGFALFVAALGAFAVSGVIANEIEENGFVPIEEIAAFFNIDFAVVVAMLIAIPAGLGAGTVGVAARAILLERAPVEGRGRIFATQSWMSGVLSLLPIFIAGALSTVIDVRITLFIVALSLAAAAIYARFGLKPPRPEALAA